MQLLGIDLGTSSLKALLVEANGRVLSQGSAEYPIRQPRPDHAEQEPDDWWQATITAVRMTLAKANEPHDVAAIALSGQMHGTVLLDEFGELLAPAVIWPDRRSQSQVEEITRLIGRQRLIKLTGSPLTTGFQAATLRWFQQQRPALWSRVATVLAPKDYLRWRLSGELATEPSDASGTLLLDVRARTWAPELLQALGIEPQVLPVVRPSTGLAGYLADEPARELGLPADIPLICGAADTACGLLGAGVVDEGTLMLTISSGGQLVAPLGTVVVDPDGRLHTFCGALEPSADQGGWYQMGAILAAGLSLRWLRDQVFGLTGTDAYQRMSLLAEGVPPGANGLLFLPYLLGERTPHMDPQARGLFLGLTANHGRAELIRAVMEGVTFACYDAFSLLAESGLHPAEIVLAGGGARSDLWCQMVADAFGLPVRPLRTGQQAALGAALLAGAGLGLFNPAIQARAWSRHEAIVEPNPTTHAFYAERLGLFRAAYQKHREDFNVLSSSASG